MRAYPLHMLWCRNFGGAKGVVGTSSWYQGRGGSCGMADMALAAGAERRALFLAKDPNGLQLEFSTTNDGRCAVLRDSVTVETWPADERGIEQALRTFRRLVGERSSLS